MQGYARARTQPHTRSPALQAQATTLNLTKEGAPDKNYNLEVFIEGAELIKFNSNFGWVRPYTKLVQVC